MHLHPPFIITPRLLPGLHIHDSFISIEFAGETDSGRARYRYHIDTPDFEHTGDDLKSGVGGGSLQYGMESLLSFLGAAVDSYRYNGNKCTGDPDDNCSLFPENVVAWAYLHSDELQMLELDLQENSELITD